MTPSRPPLKKRPQAQEKPAQQVPFIRQLDRVAKEINPLLVIFVIGLGILDLTCYAGLTMLDHQDSLRPGMISGAYRR